MCLRMNSPTTNRVGNGGCPRPEATDRTEASRQDVPNRSPPPDAAAMANVDDLLQRWTKQIVLTIVARMAHGFSPIANPAVKGITKPPNPDSKKQENQDLPTAFLQNRILAHVKSQRRISRFRILRGRLRNPLVQERRGRPREPRKLRLCRSSKLRGMRFSTGSAQAAPSRPERPRPISTFLFQAVLLRRPPQPTTPRRLSGR